VTTAAVPEQATVEPRVITEPGVYADLPHEDYHRDPVPGGSLSCSGAKKLLPPSCPAIFDWERKNPPASTKTLDVGGAAHQIVLGTGPEIVVVEAEDWRTNKAKAERAEAYLRGAIPLLRKDYEPILAMVDKLRQHKLAMALLDQDGHREGASAFFPDNVTDVMRRCRFDVLPPRREIGRLIIPDYKTSESANPTKFAKTAMNYCYHQQHAWYADAAVALELGEDPVLVFVVQEKTAPFLVSVVQLDAMAVRIGRQLNRDAINLYAECSRTGEWPGYADNDIAHVPLPLFYERQFEEQL
jgi:hypothetical protein